MKKSSLCLLGIGLILSWANGQGCGEFEPQCEAPCIIPESEIATEEFQTFYIYLEGGRVYDITLNAIYDSSQPQTADVDIFLDDAFENSLPDHYVHEYASEEEGDEAFQIDLTSSESVCLAAAIYGWEGGKYEASFEIAAGSIPSDQTPPAAASIEPKAFTCNTVDSPSTFRMGMSVAEVYIPIVCKSAQIASFLIPAAGLLNAPCENWNSIKGIAEFLANEKPPGKSIAMVNCWEQPINDSGTMDPVEAFSSAATDSGIELKMETTGTSVFTQGIMKYTGEAAKSTCTSSTWYAAVYKSGEQTDVYDAQTKYLVDEILGNNVDEAEFVTIDATEDGSASLRSYWRNRAGIMLAQGDSGPQNENWKVRFCEISIATSASVTNTLSVFVVSAIVLMTAFGSF